MNSASSTKRKSSALLRRYQRALRRYLSQGRAASLKPAMELGRQAAVLKLETLDLARIHEQALFAYMSPIRSFIARDQILKQAGTFFAEAILPLEETHRIALEINAHINNLNRTLNQRTLELAASNRQLQKEVARRQAIEEDLRTNEQHSVQLLEQSRHLQKQLRRLSHQILSAQEEERKKISRELHDIVAQVLTGIHVQLANLKTEATLHTRGLAWKISRTQRMVERSVDIVHRFARELRPPMLDDLGLIPALHSYMKDFAKRTGLRVSLTTVTSERIKGLDSTGRTALYRVAQEALSNVALHARASRVEVSVLKVPRGLHLQIKDDGKSFEVERVLRTKKNTRLGLLGMRERIEMIGGKFMVESAPGSGTTIHAQIPLGDSLRAEALTTH